MKNDIIVSKKCKIEKGDVIKYLHIKKEKKI